MKRSFFLAVAILLSAGSALAWGDCTYSKKEQSNNETSTEKVQRVPTQNKNE